MTWLMSRTAVPDIVMPLLDSVNTALAGTAGGSPGRVVFAPGGEAAWDNCQCGQLSLVVNQRHRTRDFPINTTDIVVGNINDLGLVIDCSLQIVRCVPIESADAEPPPVLDLNNAAKIQEEDAFVVWDTVTCFLFNQEKARNITGFILNTQKPLGPEGGCAGTQLDFKFGLYVNCSGCE